MPTWFITGCSTGFGRELARAVLARGWNAVVTARDPTTLADLVSGHTETALALPLDVTDQGQIAEAVGQAEARFGGIDVLVNDAGYAYRGAVEEACQPDVRKLAPVGLRPNIGSTAGSSRNDRLHGRYFHVEDAILEPKPVQKPRPPVMVAGGGEQLTLRVVARLGDAFRRPE